MLNMLSQTTETSSITLWGVKVSPYVRKAIVMLEEKKLPYTLIETLPALLLKATNQPIPDELMHVSPLGKIPALQDVDGTTVADSAVIGAYLEKKYLEVSALYPKDAACYAKALWFENFADNILSQVVYHKIFVPTVIKPLLFKAECDHQAVQKAIQQELPPLLELIENALAENQWIAGEDFSVADIAIASQFTAMQMAGYNIDSTLYPKLSRYFTQITSRPAYQKAL